MALGQSPRPPLEAQLVEVCNQLADQLPGRAALAFEAIEAADTASVEMLSDIVGHPEWLRLPLLLTVHRRPQGAVASLIEHMRQIYGEAAIIDSGLEVPEAKVAVPFAWTALPQDVLRVLRAGSVCGATFDAGMIAKLLDAPLGGVLERLQEAADAGAPLADRGEGWFSLPPDAVGALQSGLLPSLLTYWHGRLGELLSGGRSGRSVAEPEPPTAAPLERETRSAAAEPLTAPTEDLSDRPVTAAIPEARTSHSPASYGELFDAGNRGASPRATEPEPEAPAPAVDLVVPPVRPRRPAEESAASGPRPDDQARAAAHLQAAGRTEAAVAQYLAAVREVAASGDARRAYGLALQALQRLDELPTSTARALLRAQLLLEIGSLQWHGALLGAPHTLQGALESLEAAKSALPKEASADVVARLAATIAGVCYDVGDMDSLQRALAELTTVSRQLLAAGEPLLAARLLNDQAAVYVRLGDPVRASHLLEQSRQLFEHRLGADPHDVIALEELADTHHLLARLPLHAPIRPGRERDAYVMSLEHARAAESAYQQLGQRQQLARLWETLGRLESKWGQPETAQQRLGAAFEVQRQLGDVVGLARSTAALADVYVMTGRLEEAVALLADSITLNFEKGSPLGLALNRQAVESLVHAAAQAQGPGVSRLQGAVAEVERRLAQAESALGRVDLPGEGRSRL